MIPSAVGNLSTLPRLISWEVQPASRQNTSRTQGSPVKRLVFARDGA